MKTITLGSTGITSPQNGFGALPIQRDSTELAVKLLRKAYESGMTFFDTARAYTDSEEKIGIAFGDMGIRSNIFIATKTMSTTPEQHYFVANELRLAGIPFVTLAPLGSGYARLT